MAAVFDLHFAKVLTYNGHAINDDTNYTARLDLGQPTQGKAQLVITERTNKNPVLSGKRFQGKAWNLKLTRVGGSIQELQSWFDITDLSTHQLVVKNTNDNSTWYLNATVQDAPKLEGGERVIDYVLFAADPIWRCSSTSNAVSWPITASGQTQALTVLGNKYALPIFAITPSAGSGTYAYKAYVLVYNPTQSHYPNYYLDITSQAGKGLNTQALVTASKMLATGDDLRVMVDGAEVSRWLTGINTTTTGVHLALNYPAQPVLSLNQALNNSSAYATILVNDAIPALSNLEKWKSAANKVFAIVSSGGTEIFTYTGVDTTSYQLTGVQRAQKNATTWPKVAHAIGDPVYLVEHDIWMIYGNSGAAAPVLDATAQPLQDTTNSTNTSWTWAQFLDTANNKRPGTWARTIEKSKSVDAGATPRSTIYTGNQLAYANPASEMGIALYAYQKNNNWNPETGVGYWQIYLPQGTTTVTAAGSKYMAVSNSFPYICGLYVSSDMDVWRPIWNETLTAVAAWTAMGTHSAVGLADTYYGVRFTLNGSVRGVASNYAAAQFDTVTLALASANVPVIAKGGEQSSYFLNATMAISTGAGDPYNGWTIKLSCPCAIGGTLTVNCEAQTMTFSDGSVYPAPVLVTPAVRDDWMLFSPGSIQLTWTETGTTGMGIVISWEDRSV